MININSVALVGFFERPTGPHLSPQFHSGWRPRKITKPLVIFIPMVHHGFHCSSLQRLPLVSFWRMTFFTSSFIAYHLICNTNVSKSYSNFSMSLASFSFNNCAPASSWSQVKISPTWITHLHWNAPFCIYVCARSVEWQTRCMRTTLQRTQVLTQTNVEIPCQAREQHQTP